MPEPVDLEEVRPFDAAVAAVLLAMEPGDVATYGEIAFEAGYPGRSRAVGRFLATTDLAVPWWRVVNASGRLVPGKEEEQAALLRTEGIALRNGRVV